MHHFAVLHGLYIRRGFVGAHGVQRHRQGGGLAGVELSLCKQAVAQPARVVDAEVSQHAAAAGLCAGADTHHAGIEGLGAAFDLQLCGLAHTHVQGVSSGQGGFHFHTAQVHNFDHTGVHPHPFTGLGQPLRHLPVHRAAQHGVVQRFAGDFHGSQCGLVGGAGGVQAGVGRVQRGL